MAFRLPCDWKPVLAILIKDKKKPQRYGNEQRRLHWESEWRAQAVVKDWAEAQMAPVETQMVTTAEVFLPYAVMRDGGTLAQHAQSDPAFLLDGPK
jgi:hypothetical protein